MRILQINCTYREGSTGKIVYAIHEGLSRNGNESLVCYGRGAGTQDLNVTKICTNLYAKANNLLSRFTGLMYGGCYFSTNKLITYIRRVRPDVVHLHCINGYFLNIYQLVAWLNKNKIATVLTLHAEFMYTANCGHALDCDGWLRGCGHCPRLRQETLSFGVDNTALSFQKMEHAFDGFRDHLTVVSVSDWLVERAKRAPILSDMEHRVIYNGVDTNIFRHIPRNLARQKLGLGGEKIIFHATAMFSDTPGHLKGGRYIIELAERLSDVTVVVAGVSRISGRLPANLIYVGQIQNQNLLAAYYNAADVTVIVSHKETFSMICAESLCCGTPVIGFRAGAPEQIALSEYSGFVEYGDMDGLEAEVKKWIGRNVNRQNVAVRGEVKYSNATMLENYLNIYQEIIQ